MTAPVPASPTTRAPHRPPQPSLHWRKIRRAALVAAFNGWSIAACAALSLLLGVALMTVAGAIVGVVIAAALGAFSYFEFVGRKRLLNLDPQACALLGWNQVAFMSVIVIYCVVSLVNVYRHPEFTMEYPEDLKQSISRADWDLAGDVMFKPYWAAIWKTTYYSVIVATVLAQGGNAIYYFTRRRHVNALLAEVAAAQAQNRPTGVA